MCAGCTGDIPVNIPPSSAFAGSFPMRSPFTLKILIRVKNLLSKRGQVKAKEDPAALKGDVIVVGQRAPSPIQVLAQPT